MDNTENFRLISFTSRICWIGFLHLDQCLRRVKVGYSSELQLLQSFESLAEFHASRLTVFERNLRDRFKAYASGKRPEFDDVNLCHSRNKGFEHRVVQLCRKIPYGQTKSYGELAKAAGSPRAARAVGNAMKKNLFPLIVPCHRVVAGNGIGGFSGPTGNQLKIRLLELEGVAI